MKTLHTTVAGTALRTSTRSTYHGSASILTERWRRWKAPHEIGEPIPAMVARVRSWLWQGSRVKIMTARACPNRFHFGDTVEEAVSHIDAWCLKHVGRTLEVTAIKDHLMVELWDDRAIQVIPNTGLRADDMCGACGKGYGGDL